MKMPGKLCQQGMLPTRAAMPGNQARLRRLLIPPDERIFKVAGSHPV